MLLKDVIDSKSIAAVATNDASNAIPYLGLQWFPEEKKAGLDLKWIKTHNGLPVILKPSNFDALPVLRAREGLKTEKTQMAFFREIMHITEEDEQEIMRIQDENDPFLPSVLQNIYNDTNTLVRGAEVVPEVMRMSLLMGKQITLTSDGVNYTYDYDADDSWKTTNFSTLSGTSMWDDTTNATPIDDLNRMRKVLARKGVVVKYALMNSNTFEYLLNNAQIRQNILAQNLTANIVVADADVMAVVQNRTGLTIVLYDKMYKDYAGNDAYFFEDDYVALLPEGKLGSTWYGTSPEERTAIQVSDVDVSMYGKGIAIAVKTEYGPPAKTSTTASEIVLPSFEGMDSVAVLKVYTEEETTETTETTTT